MSAVITAIVKYSLSAGADTVMLISVAVSFSIAVLAHYSTLLLESKK